MKLSWLFLLAFFLVCGCSQDESDEKSDLNGSGDDVNERVTDEVFSLIESAVKLAQYKELDEKIKALSWVQTRIDTIEETLNDAIHLTFPADCLALLDAGFVESGLYNIFPRYPESTDPSQVYCDQVSDGGGWIVFQRRTDGSESFERTWEEYRQGFGDLSNEFWLGNDNLVLLTTAPSDDVELRVDITDWGNNTAFAQYATFTVSGLRYTLSFDGYYEQSTAGNALDYHNGMDFTTIDNDNDQASGGNCADWMRGGWWFNYCTLADPNGPYLPEEGEHGALSPGTDQGVTWSTYTGHGYEGREYSLKGTEMKLRRAREIVP